MEIKQNITVEELIRLRKKLGSGILGITLGGNDMFGFGEDLDSKEQKILITLLDLKIQEMGDD